MTQDPRLGNLITVKQYRDAIHIAIVPVTAGADFSPGEHVAVTKDRLALPSDKPIGIIDPFYNGRVRKGEQCWLLLYPNTITSLRHEWTHPAFPCEVGTDAATESMLFLKQFAENQAGIDLDELIEAANSYLDHGYYLVQGGRWEGFRLPDDFWWHFQTATGRVVPDKDQGSFFSCSC